MHGKIFKKGLKKLFGLTKTKIRLAYEADTDKVKPEPLILPEIFFGQKINEVSEAEKFTIKRKDYVDYNNHVEMAQTSLCLFEVIEKVKYKYEPPKYMPKAGEEDFRLTAEYANKGGKLELAIMNETPAFEGLTLYVGENPPKNSIHLGSLVSNASFFLTYAITDPQLSENKFYKNLAVIKGKHTLLGSTLYFSLKTLGFN